MHLRHVVAAFNLLNLSTLEPLLMAAVAPRELIASKSVNSLRLGEESAASSASELARPALSRRDTEQILDYYQSEDAGRTYVSPESSYSSNGQAAHRERETTTSTQSTMRPRSAGRDTNGDAHSGRASLESVASSSGGVQRRTSQRSAGGVDKRRLAIVEVDSPQDSNSSSSRAQRSNASSSFVQPSPDHNLFARRRVDSSRLGGLALVAPPDAKLSNYTDLSPVPASAPATGVTPIGQSTKADPSSSGHQRSRSDAQPRIKGGPGSKASPRDVGIVGTLGTMLPGSPERKDPPHPERQRPSTSDGDHGGGKDSSDALTAPVFQTPKSRSPSPLPLTGDSSSPQSTAREPSLSARDWTVGPGVQLTPSIGQEKEIGRPVAGPVVLDLSSGHPVIRRSPRAMPSGLPTSDPPTSAPHPFGDRDAQRTGRLPFKPNQSGPSYLHYQPGVHSIAGPLPSPPRHIVTQTNSSPPPRPPRLLSPPPTRRTESERSEKSARLPYADAQKTAPITSLQPPVPISRGDSDFSITAVSVSSSGSTSDEKSPETSPKTPEENDPIPKTARQKEIPERTSTASSRSGSHVREGAFPASSVFLTHPFRSPPPQSQHHTLDELVAAVGEAIDEEEHLDSSDVPPPTVVEQPRVLKRSQSRPDLKRENSWVSLSAESFGGGLDDTSPPSSYPSSREGSSQVLTTALASDDGLTDRRRASLPAPPPDSQRRFDTLPRTPSLLSITRPSRSRTSSPSSYPLLPKKAPSSWPEAMDFQDVLAKKSAAERALAYAAKIRELASEETGLTDWLALNARKERRETAPSTLVPPTAATSRVFAKHPRHVSRSSMASEVTFPIRSDSYTATDLSVRPTTDMSSPTSPPSTLPYPSLAHGVGIRKRPSRSFTTDSSSRGLASPAISARSLGSGFFASIGRKASIRKDRTFAPTSPTKLISSRQPAPFPQPRPVKLGAPPTLPGGPRAPARSTQRTNSVVSPPAEHSRPEGQVLSMPTHPVPESTESFDRQVEKLSDLLPQADKEVLASYLRRAYNQDPMLAIGTYLEDEKQGTLRSD